MKTSLRLALILSVAAALGACASSSPDVIKRGDAQRMAQVEDAVILSIRDVTVDGNQSGTGAAVGGVVGAIGGYGGGSGRAESQVLGILAGVAGAAAGNAIERFATREDAVEILVQLKGGERRAIVQAKAGEKLEAGDPVIIVTTGGKVRVTKAPK
jgi:outer membrane lipoprotein SlyB